MVPTSPKHVYRIIYRSRKLMRSSETSGGPRQSSLMELQLRLELGHLDYWWTLMKELLEGWALQQFQTTPKKCWKISCPPWRFWSWKTKLSMVTYMITDDSYIMFYTNYRFSYCILFQTFFIFHNIWDNPSRWLIFFKMVKTCYHQPGYIPSRYLT